MAAHPSGSFDARVDEAVPGEVVVPACTGFVVGEAAVGAVEEVGETVDPVRSRVEDVPDVDSLIPSVHPETRRTDNTNNACQTCVFFIKLRQ